MVFKRISIVLIIIFIAYYIVLSFLAHTLIGPFVFIDVHKTFYKVALYKNNKLSFKQEFLNTDGTHKFVWVDTHMKKQCAEIVPYFWKCLFHPMDNDSHTLDDGEKYNYHLPPFTYRMSSSKHSKKYATLSRSIISSSDIKSLQRAGWKYDEADQMSAGATLEKNGIYLSFGSSLEFDDEGCISDIYVNINKP